MAPAPVPPTTTHKRSAPKPAPPKVTATTAVDNRARAEHGRDRGHHAGSRGDRAGAEAEARTQAESRPSLRPASGHDSSHRDDHPGSRRIGGVQRRTDQVHVATRPARNWPASSTPPPTPRAPAPPFCPGLAAGTHRFSVRATDKAGNVGKPASVEWRYVPPDTTAPSVTLTSTPPASTTETSASFAFTASEPDVAFECSLDGVAYAACTSPASYQSLGVGAHSFAVRGRDAAGNVGQPASFGWSIVAPPPPPPPPLPDLYVASFTKNTIVIRNGGNAAAGSIVDPDDLGRGTARSPCRISPRAPARRSTGRPAALARTSRPSTGRTSSQSRTRRTTPRAVPTPPAPDRVGLEQGLELIAAGEFFAAHEELEDEWREAPPEERDFLQGLVHVDRRLVPGRPR